MRKIAVISAVLACILAVNTTAYAAGTTTYELSELNLEISVPSDWMTFTRNIEEDDPNLGVIGKDKNTLYKNFVAKCVYLSALCMDPLREIVVVMPQYEELEDIYDFNLISETKLDSMAGDMIGSSTASIAQVNYTGYSIYHHSQAVFIVYDMYQQFEGSTVYGKQYYTIINGQAINVTLYSYSCELTEDMVQELKDAVDSVHFTKVTEKPAGAPDFKLSMYKSIGLIVLIMLAFYVLNKVLKHKS